MNEKIQLWFDEQMAMGNFPSESQCFYKELELNDYKNYLHYLRSPAWKAVSKQIRDRDGCCIVCGGHTKLSAHHRYRRLGYVQNPNLNDLVTVCDKHHKQIHGLIKHRKIQDVYEVDRRLQSLLFQYGQDPLPAIEMDRFISHFLFLEEMIAA